MARRKLSMRLPPHVAMGLGATALSPRGSPAKRCERFAALR